MTTETKRRAYKPRTHNDTDPAKTGRIIRQLRLNKEITQEELATAAGYSRASCISNVETGYRALPDGKLLKIARYLGVDADKIRKPSVKVPR
jgi:transcriptional regulator with XRE-family HTH domain